MAGRHFGLVPFSNPWSMWREPRDNWSLGSFNPSRILDQNFGLGLSDEELLPPTLYQGFYIRPRRNFDRQTSGVSEVKVSEDGSKFQVLLDVNQFTPDELSVKTVDNCVVVHGKHQEKIDQHGFVSREFTRRYLLPEGVLAENVTSALSPDGVLTVEAPKPAIEAVPPKNERQVPILQSTASPAAAVQASPQHIPTQDAPSKTN